MGKQNHNVAASAETNPQQYVAYAGDGYQLTYDQAQFVAKAATAYPKLVEALRSAMESLDDAARAPKVMHDRGAEAVDICALLRSLGESE